MCAVFICVLLTFNFRAKNTPLHVIVLYKKIVTDFLTIHAIIIALLEAGHLSYFYSFFHVIIIST